MNNKVPPLSNGAIVLLSNDGNYVAVVSKLKIRVWDVKEKNMIGCIDGMLASFAPSCCHIVTILGNTIKVWNLNTSKCECELTDRCEEFHSVSFRCDNQHILTVSDTCDVKEWSLTSSEFTNKMIAFPNIVHSLECSSDGKQILISSSDRTVKIIRTEDLKCVGILIGHSDWVEDAYYSNSGNFIIIASRDGNMKIWDAKTYSCLHTINLYASHYYNPLDFDEKYIISLQKDNTVLILDTLSLQPVKKANRSYRINPIRFANK